MHSIPSGQASPPPHESTQAVPPPWSTAAQVTTALPVVGGAKQSHASSHMSMLQTEPTDDAGLTQSTDPGWSGVADQPHLLFMISGPSLHAFQSPGG